MPKALFALRIEDLQQHEHRGDITAFVHDVQQLQIVIDAEDTIDAIRGSVAALDRAICPVGLVDNSVKVEALLR